MKRTGLFTGIVVLAACFAAQASIVGYTNTFSTAADTNGWTSVGGTPVTINHVAATTGDFNDGDTNASLAYTAGMLLTGDGIYNDGGLKLNVNNTTARDEAMGYTLSGTLELNEKITVDIGLCNLKTSTYYYFAIMQLWDITANKELARYMGGFSSNSVQILAGTAVNFQPLDLSFDYTAVSADVGHQVQIRVIENGTAATRDVFVDNVAVTSVIPEPATLGLFIIGCAGAAMMRNYSTR